MPIVGIGLYFALAIFCAIHAVRHRQPLYWLFILFAFPLLGSLVYFLAIYLPNSRLQRNALKAVSAAARAIDPQREVREARTLYDETPTAQNRMRLASALQTSGKNAEAVAIVDKLMADPQLHPQIKKVAQQVKDAATAATKK